MKTVGIFEEIARSGIGVVVTRRGKPLVRIDPVLEERFLVWEDRESESVPGASIVTNSHRDPGLRSSLQAERRSQCTHPCFSLNSWKYFMVAG